MRTLYFDCSMGAAGDMLMAALLELHPDPEDFLERLNALQMPGVSVRAGPAVKCGIAGTQILVTVHDVDEEDDEILHEHTHKHSHHHSDLTDIAHIISSLRLLDEVKEDVLAVYAVIAGAESFVHKKPVAEVHFHEVGMLDAVADISGVCLLMKELGPERVFASPVHIGSGEVRCAHGILPVPAPATAYILQGIPTYSGTVQGELCTPTGAALIRYFCSDFIPMPDMKVEKIGCGMGKRDFEIANCVRAIWGKT
jgi:uncharacterized protein (TIGR00299 family) protein